LVEEPREREEEARKAVKGQEAFCPKAEKAKLFDQAF